MTPAPPGATSGSSTSVAGRLFTTFASSAAIAAIASSAGSPEPDGNTDDIALSIPLTMTARTTTPSANTNTRNDTCAERTMSATEVCRRLRLRTASTDAPMSATQAGATPTDWPTTNPVSVSPTTTNTNTGGRGAGPTSSGLGCTRRSPAKNHRKITYSVATAPSHGNAISTVNLVNEMSAV